MRKSQLCNTHHEFAVESLVEAYMMDLNQDEDMFHKVKDTDKPAMLRLEEKKIMKQMDMIPKILT